MSYRRFVVLAALALAGIGTIHADGVWVIREDGVGPAKVGMTLSQLSNALGEKLSGDNQGCFFVEAKKHPHTGFMIIDGHFVRVDVNAAGIPTVEGVQVGDSEAKARSVYGPGLKIEDHQYVEGGHYLTVRSRDGHYGIRFETDNKGKITGFYAGQFEAIQYVEGCL